MECLIFNQVLFLCVIVLIRYTYFDEGFSKIKIVIESCLTFFTPTRSDPNFHCSGGVWKLCIRLRHTNGAGPLLGLRTLEGRLPLGEALPAALGLQAPRSVRQPSWMLRETSKASLGRASDLHALLLPRLLLSGAPHPQKEVGSSHKPQGQRLLSATTTSSPQFLPIITIPGSHSRPTVCQTLCSIRMRAKPLQSCLALCNSMNFNPLGPSVRGILQTRLLEWVAVPSSRGSSQPRDQTWACCTGRGFFTTSATWEALRSIHIAPYSPDSPLKELFRGRKRGLKVIRSLKVTQQEAEAPPSCIPNLS